MKKFLIYVLACFLLCNSVLADFEEVVSGETQIPLEEVDEVVSSVPDLVNSATSEAPSGESTAEVSPGGNTVYVLTNPVKESETDVGASPANPVLTNEAKKYGFKSCCIAGRNRR